MRLRRHVTRDNGDEFSRGSYVGLPFYEFNGARDPEVSGRLEQAIARDRGAGVKSLRRDHHPKRIRAGCMATFGALSCR